MKTRFANRPKSPSGGVYIHAILHRRARAMGLKCVIVPPEAVRALLLKIGKTSPRLPRGRAVCLDVHDWRRDLVARTAQLAARFHRAGRLVAELQLRSALGGGIVVRVLLAAVAAAGASLVDADTGRFRRPRQIEWQADVKTFAVDLDEVVRRAESVAPDGIRVGLSLPTGPDAPFRFEKLTGDDHLRVFLDRRSGGIVRVDRSRDTSLRAWFESNRRRALRPVSWKRQPCALGILRRCAVDSLCHRCLNVVEPDRIEMAPPCLLRNRAQRFFYNGLHSLSFPWLYNHRPLWDMIVIVFMLGGTTLCLDPVLSRSFWPCAWLGKGFG